MHPRLLVIAAALLGASSALAQLPSAQLTSVFPPGGKRGAAVEVTIAGADLDDADSLIFNHPGIAAKPKWKAATDVEPARPIPGQFEISIDADVPAGIYEVRAWGRFGLSNPRCFVVGGWEEKPESGGNSSPAAAVELPVGTTLSGRIEPSTFDYVRLSLRKEEPVLLEVAARRIDSRLDATLTILDPSGRELKRVKQGAGADPVVLFKPPADGSYLIKLNDEVYGGGNDYFYRLTVSPGAYVDYVFPPSGVAGSTATYTIYGRNLPGGKPAGLAIDGFPLQMIETSIALPGSEEAIARLQLSGAWPLSRTWQDGIQYCLPTASEPANPVSIYFAKAASIVREQEPNNRGHEAQQITLPCEFVGQFYPERDFDWLEFEARQGQTWWIEAMANQLGLPSDPSFILYRVKRNERPDAQQTEIVQVDDLPERGRRNPTSDEFDATSDDPAYKFVVPEDGTYRLLIRDQFGDGRKDPSFVYRLAIRPQRPDFRLLAYTACPPPTQQMQTRTPLAAASVRRGGTAALQLVVQRRDDFDGEIQVTAEGLPPGVTSPGAVLGGDVSTGALVLMAAEDAPAFAGPIKIVARATVGGQELVREARYATVVWGTANRTQQPADFRLADNFQLGVIAHDTEAALVKLGEDKVYETALGGNVEIPVEVKRRGDFNDPIKLVAVGLSSAMRPKDVTLAAGAARGKLELTLNQQSVRPGSYTFYMKGETKRRYERNPQAIAACEQEQKRIAQLIEKLRAEAKAAKDAKDEAAARKALKNIEACVELQSQADKRLQEAKTANQARDIPVALISTPVRLRIHASPIKIATSETKLSLKAGKTARLPVSVERLFGFADQVDLTLEPPPGASGLAAQKATLKQGQSEAKMELTATDKVPAGSHQCILRARGRFNNVQVESTLPVSIQIQNE